MSTTGEQLAEWVAKELRLTLEPWQLELMTQMFDPETGAFTPLHIAQQRRVTVPRELLEWSRPDLWSELLWWNQDQPEVLDPEPPPPAWAKSLRWSCPKPGQCSCWWEYPGQPANPRCPQHGANRPRTSP